MVSWWTPAGRSDGQRPTRTLVRLPDLRPANEDRQRKVLEARIDRYQRAVQALQEEAERTRRGQSSGVLDDEIKANLAELEKAKAQLAQLS